MSENGDQEMLVSLLKRLRTRYHEPCSWFLVTKDPKEVRKSEEELKRDPEIRRNGMDNAKMAEEIIEAFQKEKESRKIQRELETLQGKLNEMLSPLVERSKRLSFFYNKPSSANLIEAARRLSLKHSSHEAQIAKEESGDSSLVGPDFSQNIEIDFACLLDDFVSNYLLEELQFRKMSGSADSLPTSNRTMADLNGLQQVERDLKHFENKLTKGIKEILSVLNKEIGEAKKQKRMNRMLEENKRSAKETSERRIVTRKEAEIKTRFEHKSTELLFEFDGIGESEEKVQSMRWRNSEREELGVLNGSQELCILDGKRKRVLKKFNVGVETKRASGRAKTIEFSPNGQFIAVLFESKSLINVHNVLSAKLKSSFENNSFEAVLCLKWVNDMRFWAGFGMPGALRLFEIKQPRHLAEIKLKETVQATLNAMLFCPNQNDIVVACSNDLVMKTGIDSGFQRLFWSHKQHSRSVLSLSLSKCGKIVASGSGGPIKVVLAKETTGEILGSFKGPLREVFGITWFPNDSMLFCASRSEAVVLLVQLDHSAKLVVLDEAKSIHFDKSYLNQVQCCWRDYQLDHFIVGTSQGRIFKMKMTSPKRD